MLQKRHYILIANAIRGWRADLSSRQTDLFGEQAQADADALVRALCAAMIDDNRRFDVERFKAACAAPATVGGK